VKGLPIGPRSDSSDPKKQPEAARKSHGNPLKNPGAVMSASAPRPKIEIKKGPAQGPAPSLSKVAAKSNGAVTSRGRSPVEIAEARLKTLEKDRAERLKSAPRLSKRNDKPTGLDRIKSRKPAPRSPSGFRDSVAVTAAPADAVSAGQVAQVPAAAVAKLEVQRFEAVMRAPALPVTMPQLDVPNDTREPVAIGAASATFAPAEPPKEPIKQVEDEPPPSTGLGRFLFAAVAAFMVVLVIRGN
jgi:hypothetical protein